MTMINVAAQKVRKPTKLNGGEIRITEKREKRQRKRRKRRRRK